MIRYRIRVSLSCRMKKNNLGLDIGKTACFWKMKAELELVLPLGSYHF